jgi:ubiquinone/menaquinone biosynthesis C-methylase UbiE
MPIFLGATHACDLSSAAGELLRRTGYAGKFTVADCRDLPYHDKEFDVAVMTEVIEHLPEMRDVHKALRELERVAKKWVATTPRASASGFRDKWNIEETHKQFLTRDDMVKIALMNFPDLVRKGKIKLSDVEHYVFVRRL